MKLVLTGFVTLLIVILIGCHAKSWQSMTPDEKLYRSKCSACHALPDPGAKTDAQWGPFIEEHGGRLKLSAGETEQIIRYFQDKNNTR